MPPGQSLDTLLEQLTVTFESARDPIKALPMRAYLRNQFVFLGIAKPERVLLEKPVLAALVKARPDEPALDALVRALWAREEREYQYAALRILRRRKVERLLRDWFSRTDEMDVGRHANDYPAIGVVRAAIQDPAPDRVGVLEIFVREEFVDHDHAPRLGVVGRRHAAPTDDLDPCRGEVPR